VLVAHLSDIHAEDDAESLIALFRALDYLRPIRPDAVLVSGDIANKPWTRGYMLARQVLGSVDMPIYMLPGNVDGREAMRAAFSEHRYWPKFGPMHFSRAIEEMRLVALDVTVPGESYGQAGARDLKWLQEQVNTGSPLPVIVMTHQHLFATGMERIDRNMCVNGDAVLDILNQAADPVVAVVCGHGHRPTVTWLGKFFGIMAPSLTRANPVCYEGRGVPLVSDAPGMMLYELVRGHLTAQFVSFA